MAERNPLTGYTNAHLCTEDSCGRFGAFGFTRPGSTVPHIWACNDPAHRRLAEERAQTAQASTVAPAKPEDDSPPWNA
ncbi:MAG TPA: hypothetical protein VEB20_13005 [Azospirillaceae bacterium]|nr:hypothetical protein [Azospirillaceae bacterium]